MALSPLSSLIFFLFLFSGSYNSPLRHALVSPAVIPFKATHRQLHFFSVSVFMHVSKAILPLLPSFPCLRPNNDVAFG